VPGPNATFAFIIATLLGAVFHLVVGGDARRLALFLLAGWIGFGLGHTLGVIMDINLFNIGTLRIVAAIAGAVIALLAAAFFTGNRRTGRSLR
jgi:hypothetical protein